MNPAPPQLTPDDFRRWWRETGSASPAPSPEMLLTANAWAQHCLDRYAASLEPEPQFTPEEVEMHAAPWSYLT